MKESLFSQGVDLLIYGMGTVFVFLVILILATNAMSYFIRRFLPEPEPIITPQAAPKLSTGGSAIDARTLGVLQAAVDAYRKK